jgi:hypothetical protein
MKIRLNSNTCGFTVRQVFGGGWQICSLGLVGTIARGSGGDELRGGVHRYGEWL